MAEELGIQRCWFHTHHYDIPKRRIDEIQAKCTVVPSKTIVKIISQGNRLAQLMSEAEEEKHQVDTIGKGSIITDDDRQWLSDLADHLYETGWYTKAIYLDCLLNNSGHQE